MNRLIHGFNESKGYCAETCPDVDRAFSDAWDDLKELIAPQIVDEAERLFDGLLAKVKSVGTEKLRAALCEAITDKESVEGERDDLARQVSALESEVSDLKSEVENLNRQLGEVSA